MSLPVSPFVWIMTDKERKRADLKDQPRFFLYVNIQYNFYLHDSWLVLYHTKHISLDGLFNVEFRQGVLKSEACN